MTCAKIFTFSALGLILTVPWFFTTPYQGHLFGFPLWALYSLFVSLLYSILVIIILQRYWHLLANNNGEIKP